MNNNNSNFIEEDTKPRERIGAINAMKKVMAEKTTVAEQKAYYAKMSSICKYHDIKLEELLPEKK